MISTASWAVHPLGSPHDTTSCASLSCSREAQVHESRVVSQESLARVTHGQWNQQVPSPYSVQSLPVLGRGDHRQYYALGLPVLSARHEGPEHVILPGCRDNNDGFQTSWCSIA